jgi:uncharacterized protein YqcC (DUF446 family)
MRDELRELLASLERELRIQQRWGDRQPSQQALSSTEPFAVDTLEFDQWLQWIFLPKLHERLARQLPLPQRCAVQPMAEEIYAPDDPSAQRLITIIAAIDALLSGQDTRLH